uniref:Peptidase S1 domain-containing protein n=1 Tax=Setaria viridis TaxID=4556 RepID=A0A4U6TB56_SETVI|nr:hypothetical protein SEVIR_8G031100v2 [Setaria viridis]
MWYTGGARVRDFAARVLYNDQVADLAVIEATVAVGYCDVEDHGWARTPTLSTGVTTSYPYRRAEGGRDRVLVDLSCVATPGMSGCPVVSVGGRVLGMMASGVVETDTKRLVATQAIYAPKVLDVMKQWLHLPDNDAITIDQVIGML